MAPSDISASQMAAHTAYRLGIIHFRALFAFTRLLPAYRLYRRLRRANNGLRLGIKLWGTEGYLNTPEDLEAAWEVMERGMVPLDTGLDKFAPNETTSPDTIDEQQFPSVNLFGTTYSMSVDYRTDVDFTVEDMESVLSEKFVDMDEDWFKPTVARHRMEDEAKPIRKVSNPTSIPITSPIPQRQQAAAPGSFGSTGPGSRPSQSRLASVGGGSIKIGSQGSGRWGALAENMPFAAPSAPTEQKVSLLQSAKLQSS
jgi:autophagy-related protein 13